MKIATDFQELDPRQEKPMAISNAEKQRRFRARNLGPGGSYERLSAVIPIATKRQLERLAIHYGRTLAGMIGLLVHERTVSLLNSLNEVEREEFYSEAPVHNRSGTDESPCHIDNCCDCHDES